MICKMCRTAADMQSRSNELPEGAPLKDSLKIIGEELHMHCQNCDCQHRAVISRGQA